ncbi:ABC transporter permease [Solwaraspora sp. WMMD1047]|uniref:FtsX-like permease family protein n=1 Tax=Solwaraspora sp. WMMD1047 TaxID=3016102 RepID=UPI00241811F3|nr:FtsX-like permease family protein [Solwaraspora sp. WMMD1047]MDG4834465.1 ABC transporter permease [Solwaraspora sp. WMMD1047]
MMLVFRRARAALGLLLAATGATLIATALLTGLATYSSEVIDSGTRSAVAAAPAQDRSILVRGTAGGSATTLTDRDTALRDAVATGFDDHAATVSAAGFAAGRQLTGDTGAATPDADGVVYAAVTFLDRLPEHAELTAGAWPRPGGTPLQTALAEPVATLLGVTVGDRVPVGDRITGRVTELAVVGVWRPVDPADSYWRLVPYVTEAVAPQSATYGPLTVDRADFVNHFLANASAAWLVQPELTEVTRAGLGRLRADTRQLADTLPETTGLGSSGLVSTGLDQLVERLQRANLVGRSALVTPVLLVVVLGGYALLLVAALLTEHRRGETALLRARGAGRAQLAGLAAREAALVVLPAALLAPLVATAVLRQADRLPMLTAAALRVEPRLDATGWLVAALAAAGCALAMLGPALRRGGTYTSDLASRSRPNRRAAAQRAGADLALIGLAVLGWTQLREYSSPLAGGGDGGLGIDPLLAATPTLGVLAGTVLSLRLLPPATRLAERYVDRKPWTATMLGMWQAGRRPHAGPVLLLALAVAVGTLAWCLASTSERSLVDQANHQVGADLRLVEATGAAPDERAGQLAELPGAPTALPAWRDNLRLGALAEPASMVALDGRAGADVLLLRDDLAGGSPDQLLRRLAGDRPATPVTELPVGTRRLTGQLRTSTAGPTTGAAVQTAAVLVGPAGHRLVPLGSSRSGEPLRFAVDLPAAGADPARLAGFLVESDGLPGLRLSWQLTELRAVGGSTGQLDLTGAGTWQAVDRTGAAQPASAAPDGLTAGYQVPVPEGTRFRAAPIRFAVAAAPPADPVPVLATPPALAALRLAVGDDGRVTLGGVEVEARIAGQLESVPGGTEPAALLVDLPALRDRLFHGHGIVRPAQEWWLAAPPGPDDGGPGDPGGPVAAAAADLAGIRVLDRQAVASDLARDPYGVGARSALFAAALGALLLAGVGIAVDVRATARRRVTELAVLRTLGAGPRLLARALLAEQGFLAGMGVLVGLAVGIAVAATMAPLVILTPAADRPSPVPLLAIDWPPVLATAGGLLLLALAMSALVAAGLRQRLAAAHLRIGADQ